MKRITKIISLLLCLCILFSACTGEKKTEETTVPVEDVSDNETTEKSNKMGDGKVVLPYNQTDGLNPFFAKSSSGVPCSIILPSSRTMILSAFVIVDSL